MREYIELLRLMLSAYEGETVAYTGEYYRVDEYRRLSKPVRKDVPLLVGATGRRMLELAGQIADGVVAPALNCRQFLEQVVFPNILAGRAAIGKPTAGFRLASVRICSTDDDADVARTRARRQIAYYVGIAPSLATMLDLIGRPDERASVEDAFRNGDLEHAATLLSDDAVDELALSGTAYECRAQLTRFSKGLDTVILYPPGVGLSKTESDQAHAAVLDAFA
jgi:alkanesulfonate monooxygenase SsuD/methylene tetrahydromethanopterin reductase-like flavin-dependent oxidoreductase (luciferase family)